MPKFKYIDDFNEPMKHINDKHQNLGYNYERNIFKNVLSLELFMNPVNDIPFRLLERLIEYLINSVKQIKLHYAFALPKNTKYIN